MALSHIYTIPKTAWNKSLHNADSVAVKNEREYTFEA